MELATAFLEFWKRKSSELALHWNVYNFKREEPVRSEFYGEERISRITGKKEKYYAPEQRFVKYIVSNMVMVLMVRNVAHAMNGVLTC